MPVEDPTLGADANSSMPAPMPDASTPEAGADMPTPEEGDTGMETPEEPQTDTEETPEDGEQADGMGDDNNNSITKKIDDLKTSLNADHLEAWAKYGESMAEEESDEASEEPEEPEAENPLENPITPQEAGPNPAPMAESVIFTKGQMKRLNETRLRKK